MDQKRIRQILSSSAEINVHYHGVSVWIDGISEDGNTATVHLKGSGGEESNVAISELEEM